MFFPGLKPNQIWSPAVREKVFLLLDKKLLKASVIDLLDDMVILQLEYGKSNLTDLLIRNGLEADGKLPFS